jgi:hypothetical protein
MDEARTEAARTMLADLGRALDVAIIVDEIEGTGPVTLRGAVMYGSDAIDVKLEAPTEAEALVELGRRALQIRRQDQSWIRRYGLGMG